MTLCHQCAKRVPPVNEVMCRCRCDHVFCVRHRLPETHACTFEYRYNASALQKCVAAKV